MTADTALQEALNDMRKDDLQNADLFRSIMFEKGYVLISIKDADILADLANLIRKGCEVSPDTLQAIGREGES